MIMDKRLDPHKSVKKENGIEKNHIAMKNIKCFLTLNVQGPS